MRGHYGAGVTVLSREGQEAVQVRVRRHFHQVDRVDRGSRQQLLTSLVVPLHAGVFVDLFLLVIWEKMILKWRYCGWD